MNCPVCKHGEMVPGLATVTLERAGTTIVFKDVPALVCDNCGEEFVSEANTAELLRQASAVAQSGATVDVRPFAA
jgi:YgiT-type zinc finger domain-containing protein